MATKSAYIISYDIREKKRLRQLHKLISSQAQRLQLSVYYLECTATQRQTLIEQISAIINQKIDDVRIYPIPKLHKLEWFGAGKPYEGLFLIQ